MQKLKKYGPVMNDTQVVPGVSHFEDISVRIHPTDESRSIISYLFLTLNMAK